MEHPDGGTYADKIRDSYLQRTQSALDLVNMKLEHLNEPGGDGFFAQDERRAMLTEEKRLIELMLAAIS